MKNKSNHFVYVVRCADASLYTGYSTDVTRRVREHNGEIGNGARYTKYRRPVELVYQEVFSTRSEALKREYIIKQMSHQEKEELIKRGEFKNYTFSVNVWLYPGESASWHFVTVPKEVGLEIKELSGGKRRGFGAVKVEVKIGETIWQTSIFPDKMSGSYLLPLKAKVRKDEDIEIGDTIEINIKLVT